MLTFLFWIMVGEGKKTTPEELTFQTSGEARLLEVLRIWQELTKSIWSCWLSVLGGDNKC